MAVRYDRFFKKLADLGWTDEEIISRADVSGSVIARMKRNQYISMESVRKICLALHCEAADILEFVSDEK